MSPRFPRACLVATLILASVLAPAGAQTAKDPAATRHPHRRLVQRVYPVADLVIPLDKGSSSSNSLEDRLVQLVVQSVEPHSWSCAGGQGTIQYYPLGMALVVNQKPAIQKQVDELLTALRHLQDVEVAVEVRLVGVSPACGERLGVDFNTNPPQQIGPLPAPVATAPAAPACPPRPVLLNDKQVAQLLETVQSDPQTSVLQTPKLTVANGQAAGLEVADKLYLRCVQDTEPVAVGLRMAVQPVVSVDHRSVHLNFKINQTELACAGGPAEHVVSTLALDRTLTIPDGTTAVMGSWTRMREGRHEYGPPVLSKLPYISRLFKNVGYGREPEKVLVLVTPRILVHEEEEIRQVAAARPATEEQQSETDDQAVQAQEHKLVRLLARYERACAEGRLTDARTAARRALAIDPTCFSKHATTGSPEGKTNSAGD